jgi:indolepyruvate ferredoxin oxidoreductase beta subunit
MKQQGMKQQIIVSGMGGQGVLFLTRIIALAGIESGFEVLTSETHGMAQRGGSVISTIKVGAFKSPLVRSRQADTGIFLHPHNLPVHGHFLKPGVKPLVNTDKAGDWLNLDATARASELGSPVYANLILLGFGIGRKLLFTGPEEIEKTIAAISGEKFARQNLEAFRLGLEAA